MSEQKIIDLEMKFSFQESALEELQKTVHEQYMMIQKLEKELQRLSDLIKSGDEIDISHVKPPHY